MSKVPIISIKEARKLLGKEAESMSDDQIFNLINNLDVIAKYALREVREKRRKEDAIQLANLIYDIYKEKKSKIS